MPLALALAALGEREAAASLADAVVERFENLECRGIHLVLAYETRARVAMAARETALYIRYAALCAEQCAAANSRVLNAKYEKLKRAAISADARSSLPVLDAPDVFAALTGSKLTSILVGCNLPNDRAQRAIDLLMKRSGVQEGYLYLLGPHGPSLVAQLGRAEPSRGLAGFVDEYLDAQLQDNDLTTRSQEAETAEAAGVFLDEDAARCHAILLSHQNETGSVVTGLAIAVTRNDQAFAHPGTLAAHLSRLFHDAGDVKAIALH
jgi:hypothetical protein